MAYVPSELRLIVSSMGNNGSPQVWALDGEDAHDAADVAGFISDASKRGMRVGDIVFYRRYSAVSTKASLTNITMHYVAAISNAGAGDLSNIASVTMTNTD